MANPSPPESAGWAKADGIRRRDAAARAATKREGKRARIAE